MIISKFVAYQFKVTLKSLYQFIPFSAFEKNIGIIMCQLCVIMCQLCVIMCQTVLNFARQRKNVSSSSG